MSLEVVIENENGNDWKKEFSIKINEVDDVFIQENVNFAQIEVSNLKTEKTFFIWKSYQQFLDFYEKIKQIDSEITSKSPFPTIGWIKSWFKSNDNLEFIVDKKICQISKTIEFLIKDKTNEELFQDGIQLNYEGKVLKKVFEYIYYKNNYKNNPKERSSNSFFLTFF